MLREILSRECSKEEGFSDLLRYVGTRSWRYGLKYKRFTSTDPETRSRKIVGGGEYKFGLYLNQ